MSYIEVDSVKDMDFVRLAITTKEVNAKSISELKSSDLNNVFTLDNLTSNIQIHSDVVYKVDESNVKKKREGDALVTNLKNVPLMIFTADCVPVVMIDKKNKAIGVAHAGWKGTYAEISKNTISLMKKEYGTDPKDLVCVIGPSIGECCYEVSEDLYLKFKDKFKEAEDICSIEDSKFFLNLWNINKYSLVNEGVLESNITSMNICTNCNSDTFYSYRAHDKTDKRIGTIVEIV